MYPILPVSRQIVPAGIPMAFSSFTGDNFFASDRKLIANSHPNSPLSPAHMDWSSHFPAFVDPDTSKTNLSGGRKLTKEVEVVDIGCGFGGLIVGLAPLMPDTLMVGKYSAARFKPIYAPGRVSTTKLTTKSQAWKFAPQCWNTSPLASTHCAANNNA